ncbi:MULTISPECIES: hypothetical protein [unclassified Sphingobacterium]|uniref:hypothetical protein n=1 Tax=unclassified Sphingobacterium TaxID=2609468 RepID=UPI0010464B11|nr:MULTISPECIES: hypothetical protein [unclassified Sphingobacterium]MCS3552871.1 Fe2+ or Zn2+ uptake regulation protein [Sphingobacterium sp. JUb21]
MKNSLNQILAKLTDQGYMISQRRHIIIAALCRAQKIESIDDFWYELRKKHHIGWSTVHTTVRLLISLGCLLPLHTQNKQGHFLIIYSENIDCIQNNTDRI